MARVRGDDLIAIGFEPGPAVRRGPRSAAACAQADDARAGARRARGRGRGAGRPHRPRVLRQGRRQARRRAGASGHGLHGAARPGALPVVVRRGRGGRAEPDAQLAAAAERGARRADARRPPGLRPADRRRAGDREHRHPVRGRRRHRVPDEAVGARPARRRRSTTRRAAARARAAHARRSSAPAPSCSEAAPTTTVLDDDAGRSRRWPRGLRDQGARAARHERLGQPLRRVRRARRSPKPDLGLEPGHVPRAAARTAGSPRRRARRSPRTTRKLARELHPELPRELLVPRVARPRLRARAGVLGRDEPDGRVRRRRTTR